MTIRPSFTRTYPELLLKLALPIGVGLWLLFLGLTAPTPQAPGLLP